MVLTAHMASTTITLHPCPLSQRPRHPAGDSAPKNQAQSCPSRVASNHVRPRTPNPMRQVGRCVDNTAQSGISRCHPHVGPPEGSAPAKPVPPGHQMRATRSSVEVHTRSTTRFGAKRPLLPAQPREAAARMQLGQEVRVSGPRPRLALRRWAVQVPAQAAASVHPPGQGPTLPAGDRPGSQTPSPPRGRADQGLWLLWSSRAQLRRLCTAPRPPKNRSTAAPDALTAVAGCRARDRGCRNLLGT